ncbi:MAG: hypothetical protein DRP45_07350 [Candidatus Zixiibacteriota bacterium]|nr:MAG: hypothetical protein DRP45_07350 [candidate division Zixibacteria bacterium]
METMFWIWMAAAAVFLIIEMSSPTLIFLCFVVGSVAAGIYAQVGPEESYYWQIGIFAIVSLVLLPFTRKFAKKISKPAPELSNVDRMIGQTALVTEKIDPDLGGRVQFEGESWVAKADEVIEEDTKVRIVKISGTRVIVEKLTS